ncbi:MAG: aminopeptidase [Xanthomonadales bacterium]|nr:aminopeptidase [Xanthomonadales bacterium]
MLLIGGCVGPGYYLQAAGGHLKLMRAREDVADVLADPGADPETVRRLRAAQDMLDFAELNLDLPANDSYSSYVRTGKPAVVWNVIVAPEFSLQARKWCFPVAGCVPYRGYFAEPKARAFAQRMSAKGFDVSVQPVTAYSTLGWFSDPLLDTMLRGNDSRLAGTLFHELAHQRFYLKGDTGFSEAYASFVEQVGVKAWIAQHGATGAFERWQQGRQAARRFRQLQASTRRRLSRLYQSDFPDAEKRIAKQQIFDAMVSDYETIVREEWAGRDYFASWMAKNRNNAALSLFRDYQQGLCAFAGLFDESQGDFRTFHARVAEQAELPARDRTLWLSQTCNLNTQSIAPAGDL